MELSALPALPPATLAYPAYGGWIDAGEPVVLPVTPAPARPTCPLKDTRMTLPPGWTTGRRRRCPPAAASRATVGLYGNITRKHLVPTLGSRALDRFRPSDPEALIVTKRAAGLAPSTVGAVYTVLRPALDVAVWDGLLRQNPAAVVKRPTVERRDAAYLTAEEAQYLLEAIRGGGLDPLFRLTLATGLRRGEALGTHCADVNLHTGRLRLP